MEGLLPMGLPCIVIKHPPCWKKASQGLIFVQGLDIINLQSSEYKLQLNHATVTPFEIFSTTSNAHFPPFFVTMVKFLRFKIFILTYKLEGVAMFVINPPHANSTICIINLLVNPLICITIICESMTKFNLF